MDTILSKKIGLIAGDGELPVNLAKSAAEQGFEIMAVSVSPDNRRQLRDVCETVHTCGPGEVQKIFDIFHKESINQLMFIGKVNKGLLFRPILDARARKILKGVKKLNDDALMLRLVNDIESENISVLDQTIFLKDFFPQKGVLGSIQPDESQLMDIEYGFQTAKEIGKLDLGQSVVAQDKMILAVETIEGTDKTIERGCKMGNGKATVVKVSKPGQDKRFDVPAVGMKTLRTMKRFGGKVLAIEAGETFAIELNKMIEFANKHKIVLIAV